MTSYPQGVPPPRMTASPERWPWLEWVGDWLALIHLKMLFVLFCTSLSFYDFVNLPCLNKNIKWSKINLVLTWTHVYWEEEHCYREISYETFLLYFILKQSLAVLFNSFDCSDITGSDLTRSQLHYNSTNTPDVTGASLTHLTLPLPYRAIPFQKLTLRKPSFLFYSDNKYFSALRNVFIINNTLITNLSSVWNPENSNWHIFISYSV